MNQLIQNSSLLLSKALSVSGIFWVFFYLCSEAIKALAAAGQAAVSAVECPLGVMALLRAGAHTGSCRSSAMVAA
jgi:hypothetical protein